MREYREVEKVGVELFGEVVETVLKSLELLR
jgi:hypothetical protein